LDDGESFASSIVEIKPLHRLPIHQEKKFDYPNRMMWRFDSLREMRNLQGNVTLLSFFEQTLVLRPDGRIT
jgi:hypothetical protein